VAVVLDVLDEAADEARAAAEWYAERNPVAATAFELEVRRAFREIVQAPGARPAHLEGTRRFLLQRFPYEIVYCVRGEVVLIVAIAHCKRRPGYWRDRAV
jgi:plasmid stabilization system protein ParE